jgi:hypothetical protein
VRASEIFMREVVDGQGEEPWLSPSNVSSARKRSKTASIA